MSEEVNDLKDYYHTIRDRGWGCWIHGMRSGNFAPQIVPGWKKRTQVVSPDRQVSVAWDPKRFTDQLGDEHRQLVEVFKNELYRVVLFPVGV